VGVMAGIIGYGLGLGVSLLAGPMITGVKGGTIPIDPLLAGGAIFLSVIIGILSSAYPAIHASKMDPTVALRSL
jgi:putative ABC transport system permease protein